MVELINEIQNLRKKIEFIDKFIFQLILERLKIVNEIGKLKKILNLPILDKFREVELRLIVENFCTELSLPKQLCLEIHSTVTTVSKFYQISNHLSMFLENYEICIIDNLSNEFLKCIFNFLKTLGINIQLSNCSFTKQCLVFTTDPKFCRKINHCINICVLDCIKSFTNDYIQKCDVILHPITKCIDFPINTKVLIFKNCNSEKWNLVSQFLNTLCIDFLSTDSISKFLKFLIIEQYLWDYLLSFNELLQDFSLRELITSILNKIL